jgi:hypothetical protein
MTGRAAVLADTEQMQAVLQERLGYAGRGLEVVACRPLHLR